MNLKNVRIIALALMLIGLLPTIGTALIVQMSLPELVSNSDAIVRGEVTKTECRWAQDQSRRTIVTDVTLAVSNSLMGNLDGTEVTVEVPGGAIGDVGLWVEDAPYFMTGQDVIVFLSSVNSAGCRTVTNWCNGKCTVTDQRIEETDEAVGAYLNRLTQAVRTLERR